MTSWDIFETNYAEYYDLTTQHREYTAEVNKLAEILAEIPAEPRGRVLDIGCGTGRHARALADLGFRTVGMDPAAAMIQIAKATPGKAEFRLGSVEKLADDDFDFVYSLGHVVNYLSESELQVFFNNVFRTLSVGGVFYFEAWSRESVLLDPPKPVLRRYATGGQYVEREVLPNLSEFPNRLHLVYRIRNSAQDGGEPIEVDHVLTLFSRDTLLDALETAGFGGIAIAGPCTEPRGAANPRFLGVSARKLPT